MPQTLIGRRPELFTEPDKFIPERWDRENKDKLPSMFAQLPFGFGARMCAGIRHTDFETYSYKIYIASSLTVVCTVQANHWLIIV